MAKGYDDHGATEEIWKHMGIAKRIPWHANRACERLKLGDSYGARNHAQECISLCAAGYRFTMEYMACIAVLKAIKWPLPNDYEQYERELIVSD